LHLLVAAGRTRRLPLPARAAAMRTRLRKHHVAARRLDRAGAVAMRAAAFGRVQTPHPAARSAALLPRDRDVPLTAGNRLLEAERDRLMQVGAAGRFVARPRLALQHVGEEIA